MFQKRRPSVVDIDPNRCELIQSLPRGQPIHDLESPSKEAESRRMRIYSQHNDSFNVKVREHNSCWQTNKA